MQLLDSIIDGALKLPDRADADALIAAVVRFMARGEEPEGLGPVADAMWTAMRPVMGGDGNGRGTEDELL